ncbi:MAG: S-layer homology domain-containing protein [Acidimicrobiia bacterium]|nr:S-layer homology domain-containing protein [Acidimicrobiia bacterium]
MTRARALKLGMAVVTAGLLVVSVLPAGAQPDTVADGSRSWESVIEAPDFATETYGDPWDFANPEDTPVVIQNLPDGPEYLMPEPSGGSVTYESPNGTQLWLVRNWGAGALATNRDGPVLPIDADRYRRLSMSVTVSGTRPVGAGAFWWGCDPDLLGVATPPGVTDTPAACAEQTRERFGGTPFTLQPGTQVVDIPLTRTEAFGPADWSGLVSTLLVTTNGGAPVDGDADPSLQPASITLDWVRLYAPQGRPTTDPHPPGAIVDGLGVLPRPRPVIVAPDVRGDEDYATVVRGKGWDMDTLDDLFGSINTTVWVNPELGRIEGTTAGPTFNDPVIRFRNPGPINARRWHRLEFVAGLEGRFDLEDYEGGGTMARFVWRNPNAISGSNDVGFQETNDIVMLPGANRILVDLHTHPAGLVTDDEIPFRLGWGGGASPVVDHPEFHPHEDRGVRDWWISELRLRRNHLADPTFDVRFRDDAHQAGTTATVALATTRGGDPEHIVASGVPVSPGENAVLLDSATLPFQHLFWVRLTLTRPNGVATTTWSSGPVETGTPVEFTDMVPGNAFFDDVFWLVKAGVADGYSPDTYGAVAPVSRQAMAAFLQRLLGGGAAPTCTTAPFDDVPVGHPFCGAIAWLVEEGIADGYDDGTFRPTRPVSRQAMAAFLHRAVTGQGVAPTCEVPAHRDVDGTSPFCGEIAWLGAAGITRVVSSEDFRPADPVSRQAMAAFLRRVQGGGGGQ